MQNCPRNFNVSNPTLPSAILQSGNPLEHEKLLGRKRAFFVKSFPVKPLICADNIVVPLDRVWCFAYQNLLLQWRPRKNGVFLGIFFFENLQRRRRDSRRNFKRAFLRGSGKGSKVFGKKTAIKPGEIPTNRILAPKLAKFNMRGTFQFIQFLGKTRGWNI